MVPQFSDASYLLPDSDKHGRNNNHRMSLVNIPRVFPDQLHRFEKEEIFRRNAQKSEVRYTLNRDRPLEERQAQFESGCKEGFTEISISSSGLVLLLAWNARGNSSKSANYGCDFVKEPGKVHIVAPLILNGVCVRWRGWIDLRILEGHGSLEFDPEAARLEDNLMKKQVQMNNNTFGGHQTRV